MKSAIVLCYLIILANCDVKEKRVPMWMLAFGTMCGGFKRLSESFIERGNWQWNVLMMCVAVLPGIFLVAVAQITKKAGIGDGWMLINIGLIETYKITIFLLGMSLMIMAIFSGILLLMHKVKKNTKLPYLPFLTLAYLCKFLL